MLIFFSLALLLASTTATAFSASSLAPNGRLLLLVDPLDDFGVTSRLTECCESEMRGGGRLLQWRARWSPAMARLVDRESSCSNKNDFDEEENVIGVLCESDTGLKYSEELSAHLRMANGVCEARRDKYMMMQRLEARGMPVVRQILTDDWREAEAFLHSLQAPSSSSSSSFSKCVIKPPRGAASKGVCVATSMEDAKRKFDDRYTLGYANGTISEAVLLQEYLEGNEYAVDTVSCNGEHKVVATWRYDKRPLNEAPFVYFASELVDENDDNDEDDEEQEDEVAQVQDLAVRVCEALDMRYGPSHIEIKFVKGRGAVLVEGNMGRFHCQDFCTLVDMCIGYCAVDVAVDAFLAGMVLEVEKEEKEKQEEEDEFVRMCLEASMRWNSLPDRPPSLRCRGMIVHLSSLVEGTLVSPVAEVRRGTDEDEDEEAVDANGMFAKSLLAWCPLYEDAGMRVQKTVDLTTTAGYALLASFNKQQIAKDFRRIIELQELMHVVR